MEKPAVTDHPIHELLATRWSPRAFREEPVTDEQISSLLEAARWSASCFNAQPWRFIVASRQQRDDFDALVGCLKEANQVWAGNAAVLVLVVASTRFEHNGKNNRHAGYDSGAAAAQLTAQATAMGLAVHQMAGFDAGKAREVHAIPENFEPMAVMAVGHPGEPGSLPDGLQERERAPRSRKPLSELVFTGTWGNPRR